MPPYLIRVLNLLHFHQLEPALMTFQNYSLGAGNVNALRQSTHDKLEPLAPQVANLNRDGQLYIELSPCSF